LHQVIVNLTDNALHAVEGREDARVQLAARRLDHAIEITVADNGPGIAEEDMGKIFEPFFTTKAVGEGTGLDLWISFTIIEDFGGTITAGRSKDGGAEFRVVLPAADGRS